MKGAGCTTGAKREQRFFRSARKKEESEPAGE